MWGHFRPRNKNGVDLLGVHYLLRFLVALTVVVSCSSSSASNAAEGAAIDNNFNPPPQIIDTNPRPEDLTFLQEFGNIAYPRGFVQLPSTTRSSERRLFLFVSGSDQYTKVWRTDGTPDGTRQLQFVPSETSASVRSNRGGFKGQVVTIGDYAYIIVNGIVWKTNGNTTLEEISFNIPDTNDITLADNVTSPGGNKNLSNPSITQPPSLPVSRFDCLTSYRGNLYFGARAASSTSGRLEVKLYRWKTDGSNLTQIVLHQEKAFSCPSVSGDRIFLYAGTALYSYYDGGTAADSSEMCCSRAIQCFRVFYPGASNGGGFNGLSQIGPTLADGNAFFCVSYHRNSVLWSTDGTTALPLASIKDDPRRCNFGSALSPYDGSQFATFGTDLYKIRGKDDVRFVKSLYANVTNLETTFISWNMFLMGQELWIINDDRDASTAGEELPAPQSLMQFNNTNGLTICFLPTNSTDQREQFLIRMGVGHKGVITYISDGTSEGTFQIGSGASALYFQSDDITAECILTGDSSGDKATLIYAGANITNVFGVFTDYQWGLWSKDMNNAIPNAVYSIPRDFDDISATKSVETATSHWNATSLPFRQSDVGHPQNITLFSLSSISPSDSSPFAKAKDNLVLIVGKGEGKDEKQLWVSDGTLEGTNVFDDSLSKVYYMNRFGDNRVYFRASKTTNGTQSYGLLFSTDGSIEGTIQYPRMTPSSNGCFVPFKGKVVYEDALEGERTSLFVSDGNSSDVLIEARCFLQPSVVHTCPTPSTGDILFLPVYHNRFSNQTRELWLMDGTSSDTSLLKVMPYDTQMMRRFSQQRFENGCFIFELRMGYPSPPVYQIWVADANITNPNGTRMLLNNTGALGTSPEVVKNKMLITLGNALYWLDGGTFELALVRELQVKLPCWTGQFLSNDLLLMTCDDWIWDLWYTDGTGNGTVHLISSRVGGFPSPPLYLSDGRLVIVDAASQVYVTDKTKEGTFLLSPNKFGFSFPEYGYPGVAALNSSAFLFTQAVGYGKLETWIGSYTPNQQDSVFFQDEESEEEDDNNI